MPVRGALVSVPGVQRGGLFKGASGQLKADGQTIAETAGDRQRREASQVERAGVLGQRGDGAWTLAE